MDPGESENVAAEFPHQVKELEAIMMSEHKPNPYFPFVKLGDMSLGQAK